MDITLPFADVVAFATLEKPLPPMIESLICEGSIVTARVDLSEVETDSRMMKLALAAGGTVDLTARIIDFTDGVAILALTAHARGLPAHKLLPYLADPIDKAVARAGLPVGLVRIDRGDGDPTVHIDVQSVMDSRVSGVTVTSITMEDCVIRLSAAIG